MLQFLKICVCMSFNVIILELILIHISFCRLMGMLDSLGGGGALSSIILIILRGRSVVTKGI